MHSIIDSDASRSCELDFLSQLLQLLFIMLLILLHAVVKHLVYICHLHYFVHSLPKVTVSLMKRTVQARVLKGLPVKVPSFRLPLAHRNTINQITTILSKQFIFHLVGLLPWSCRHRSYNNWEVIRHNCIEVKFILFGFEINCCHEPSNAFQSLVRGQRRRHRWNFRRDYGRGNVVRI